MNNQLCYGVCEPEATNHVMDVTWWHVGDYSAHSKVEKSEAEEAEGLCYKSVPALICDPRGLAEQSFIF